MLVLSRRENERILLPAVQTSIQVVRIGGSIVRLGIDAPSHITVIREELARQPEEPASNGDTTRSTSSQGTMREETTQPPAQGNQARMSEEYQDLLHCMAFACELVDQLLAEGQIAEAQETVRKVQSHLRQFQQVQQAKRDSDSRRKTEQRPENRDPKVAVVINCGGRDDSSLSAVLRKSGYSIRAFRNGCEAIDYLFAHPRPGLVVLETSDGHPAARGTLRSTREAPDDKRRAAPSAKEGAAEAEITVGPQGVHYHLDGATPKQGVLQPVERIALPAPERV